MMKIANVPLGLFYNPDGGSFNDNFWNETIFGKLIPFSPLVYVDPESGDQNLTWSEHTDTAIYVKDIKFESGGPFELVYVSPSVKNPVGEDNNMIVGVFIYKVNHDYQPWAN